MLYILRRKNEIKQKLDSRKKIARCSWISIKFVAFFKIPWKVMFSTEKDYVGLLTSLCFIAYFLEAMFLLVDINLVCWVHGMRNKYSFMHGWLKIRLIAPRIGMLIMVHTAYVRYDIRMKDSNLQMAATFMIKAVFLEIGHHLQSFH